MIPTAAALRDLLARLLDEYEENGHDVDHLRRRAAGVGADLDAINALVADLDDSPLRDDWPWREPDDLDEIARQSSADWDAAPRPSPDASDRVRAAFLGRVVGCMLGKPLELGLSRVELETGLRSSDCWPLTDYVPEAALDAFPSRQGQWPELVRERITHVAADDDINYTLLAMLALEMKGDAFTHDDLAFLWQLQLPIAATFGPERGRMAAMALSTTLAMAGVEAVATDSSGPASVPAMRLPGAELCGALIRADAYGYASPGHPARAAGLAHRDASFTHRRTGVYGSMWVAATLAEALTGVAPLEAARTGLGFVPSGSRFHDAVRGALEIVETAEDWDEANRAVVARHPEHGHCRILQEVGTLVVTLAFASDVGDGVCLQVMQGNDTDSFGATAGSILGACFGPGHLDDRWLTPFRDTIQVAMAMFETPSLSALADRVSLLAQTVVAP